MLLKYFFQMIKTTSTTINTTTNTNINTTNNNNKVRLTYLSKSQP